jgi:hypothetical protein
MPGIVVQTKGRSAFVSLAHFHRFDIGHFELAVRFLQLVPLFFRLKDAEGKAIAHAVPLGRSTFVQKTFNQLYAHGAEQGRKRERGNKKKTKNNIKDTAKISSLSTEPARSLDHSLKSQSQH